MRNTAGRSCRRRFLALGAVSLLLLSPQGVASANDGDPDFGWQTTGVAVLGVPGTANIGLGVALQCDGKVVAVGLLNGGAEDTELGVVRFNPDGYPDTSFATNGVFSIAFGAYADIGWDVAVQPDGKIVVAGTANDGFSGQQFVVLRLTENGVLDSSFSGNGYHLFEFGGSSRAHGLAIQDDGRIVVVGETTATSGMAIARLTAAGELDTTFDGDGLLVVDFTLGEDDAWDVAIQDDGRILVVGTAGVSGGSIVVVLRLLADGSYDTTFGPGAGGATAVDFGVYSEGRGLAIQRDGRIVVAGFTDAQTSVALARLTENGILDTTFGGDGMVTRTLGGGVDEGWDVAIRPDGMITVAGSVEGSGNHQSALLRFTPVGDIDLSFGSGGAVIVNFGVDSAFRAIVTQPGDGKLLAVGYVEYAWDDSRVVALRVIGDSTLVFASDFECGDTSGWS